MPSLLAGVKIINTAVFNGVNATFSLTRKADTTETTAPFTGSIPDNIAE